MTTVRDVLAAHDITTSESQLAAELRILLDDAAVRHRTGPHPAELSDDESAYLDTFAGVPAASAAELSGLDARSSARALFEAAGSLSRTQVAALVGIAETRVSHRTADGSLYAYRGASGRKRYPDWQFVDGRVVPHLADVLPRLPREAHPVTVRAFMTRPDDALVLHGEPVSPVDWLIAGGDAALVGELAETLGEQV